MYRAVELTKRDRNLHRFVWRSNPDTPLTDYCMTRVTFGVSASSFAANMAVKQNHRSFRWQPTQHRNVFTLMTVCPWWILTQKVELQRSLHISTLERIPKELQDTRDVRTISEVNEYTKTLGIEWNISTDEFRLTIAELPLNTNVTKRVIVSDVAKVFDVLGWLSPVTVKMKILLQRLWEAKVDWDDPT